MDDFFFSHTLSCFCFWGDAHTHTCNSLLFLASMATTMDIYPYQNLSFTWTSVGILTITAASIIHGPFCALLTVRCVAAQWQNDLLLLRLQSYLESWHWWERPGTWHERCYRHKSQNLKTTQNMTTDVEQWVMRKRTLLRFCSDPRLQLGLYTTTCEKSSMFSWLWDIYHHILSDLCLWQRNVLVCRLCTFDCSCFC